MLAAESPTDGAADRQAIIRETEPLQALVTAMQAGKSVDFRAIHDVAGRMAKAADEGWKKATLAHIGRATTPRESWEMCLQRRRSLLPLGCSQVSAQFFQHGRFMQR
jgi:hypothetical protein